MKALRSALPALAALFLCAAGAGAQGVTSSALTGTISDDAGAPVSSATVSILNSSNGQRSQTRTGADGRYYFENLPPGGPYTLEFRALGFEPARQTGLTLRLGQRLVIDQQLKRAAVEVAGVTVEVSDTNPYLNTARTGAQGFVSENQIRNLPTLGRNLTDYIQVIPQVVTNSVPGASVGGQNNRFNNIQIDGGVNNDLFGLAASGTPGGQADAHPISVEAVKEYQVLIAPFDVRQGSFTGGLLNAVTKSGSNQLHGSVWGYAQNEDLVGEDLAGNPADQFLTNQYGFTLGGPVIRDRLHFFVSADLQAREAPFVGQRIGDDTTGGRDSIGVGIRRTTAERVEQISMDSLGFIPGSYRAPLLANPDKNFFGKLSMALGTNHLVDVSYNYVDAGDDNLIRNSTATGFRDGYQLGNSGYEFTTTTSTTRAKLTSQFGRTSNELLLGLQTVRDERALPNRMPLVLVGGDRLGTNVAVGADRFSHANKLDQDIIEVTDNLTLPFRTHRLTVGTHNEFFKFANDFFPASLGVWSFSDTTAFKRDSANRYEIAVPLRPGGPNTQFAVQQFGFYVQDQFSPRPGLNITAGVRVDIPVMDKPSYNAALDTSVLNINTGDFPTGNMLWSPRIGINYDLKGDGSTFLRGGFGIFSGRPPYVWVSNAFGNTGLEQATLICDNGAAGYLDTVPVFTIDPNNQPQACRGGAVTAAQATPSIVYFDSDFKFPQNLKVALGLDQRLPWGMTGTLDFLYTRSQNQFYITDVNLVGIVGYVQGEAGRPLYGTLSATAGTSTPTRQTAQFRDVLRHRNESGDRSMSFTAELNKRFEGGVEFRGGYTYSKTKDLFSLTSSIAFSNFRFTVLDGTLEERNLRNSVFDIPHKVVLSGTTPLPGGFLASLIYTGQSGHPFSYVVSSDANGDGVTQNDQAYIPRNQGDITIDANGTAAGLGTQAQQDAAWNTLNNYIRGEDCLERARGTLLTRNSCRNPWIGFVNARVTKMFNTFGAQRLEVTADIFNLLHLISEDWGVVKETSAFEQVNMVNRVGFDAVNSRGIYALALPIREQVTSSRWRLQLGAKYSF